MKTRKTLCLLLALVLVVSAAGTAFATTDSWDTDYGTLSGSSKYTQATNNVAVTTSLKRNGISVNISLRNGISFYIQETGKYTKIDETIGAINQTSFPSNFPVYRAIEWTPIGARCYHGLYTVSNDRYTLVKEETTNVSF